MYRPRIIPVLLLKNNGLIKSTKFKSHRYIGDPINAVRIFNDLKADELVFLDILASKENRLISLDFVKNVGEEANMPFSVGGGISKLEHISKILETGAEKVILNTIAGENPGFVESAVKEFGSSTIAVCMDVKNNLWNKKQTIIRAGTKSLNHNPLEYTKLMENMGAGEIIVQSVDRDGTMQGYDIELLKEISSQLTIPVVALGGAGKLEDLTFLANQATINGFAAGSMFVYHGPRKAVLINYPGLPEIQKTLQIDLYNEKPHNLI
jgi:imidazole glycerol-phosphate synthase subunit HisF